MAKLVVPATAPLTSVLRAGVIPSMSAVRWLSSPQHVQAAATSSAARSPGQPAPAGQDRARAHDPRDAEPAHPTQVLAEEGDAEHGRGHHLEV